jgi:hypothetical protein
METYEDWPSYLGPIQLNDPSSRFTTVTTSRPRHICRTGKHGIRTLRKQRVNKTKYSHTYFVLFRYSESGGDFGFGRSEISRNKPIKDIKDVEVIEEYLRNRLSYVDLVILNWQRFESE